VQQRYTTTKSYPTKWGRYMEGTILYKTKLKKNIYISGENILTSKCPTYITKEITQIQKI